VGLTQTRHTSSHTRALSGARLTPSRGAGRDPRYHARASTLPTAMRPTASCRIVVDDTDSGTREFATLDRDGNLVTFLQWVAQ
jgi:hypothetical protein